MRAAICSTGCAPPFVRQDHRQANQHAEKHLGVHAGNADVVAQDVEMGNAVERIGDPGLAVAQRDATPVHAHQDFAVEIHALADVHRIDQGHGRREWIDAIATH
jgi:hypothetical protein